MPINLVRFGVALNAIRRYRSGVIKRCMDNSSAGRRSIDSGEHWKVHKERFDLREMTYTFGCGISVSYGS
jgi:hypothetical protein